MPPAVAPPIPTLGSVHHANGSARRARRLVDARVSVQAEGRIGSKRRRLFLRTDEFGFVRKGEILEVRERMNVVWDDSRVLPFLGVEAIAAGNLAKQSLQLVELKRSQAFPWRRFIDLVEEGHRFLQLPKNIRISQCEIKVSQSENRAENSFNAEKAAPHCHTKSSSLPRPQFEAR